MTEDQVAELARQALQETPAKAAEITLVLQDGDLWIVLLKDKGEELAVKVRESPDSSVESLKQGLIQEIRKLF